MTFSTNWWAIINQLITHTQRKGQPVPQMDKTSIHQPMTGFSEQKLHIMTSKQSMWFFKPRVMKKKKNLHVNVWARWKLSNSYKFSDALKKANNVKHYKTNRTPRTEHDEPQSVCLYQYLHVICSFYLTCTLKTVNASTSLHTKLVFVWQCMELPSYVHLQHLNIHHLHQYLD